MSKHQPKFKSFIAWQKQESERREYDPGRDDEGDRRYMVSVGDEEAVFADAERRVKILVDRLEGAFLNDDAAKVKSCAKAIVLICQNHRPKGWKGYACLGSKAYLVPDVIKELMQHAVRIGKGDLGARKAALATTADFANDITK